MDGDLLDADLLLGPVLLVDVEAFDLGEGGKALVAEEAAEDGVEAVEVGRLVEEDEELAAVGVGTLVGHADDTAGAVLQGRADLVLEGGTVDGAAALGVVGRGGVRRGAGLDHEGGDEAMEGGFVVVPRSAEGEEVLDEGLGDVLGPNLTMNGGNQRHTDTHLCGFGDAIAKDLDLQIP